MSLFSSSHIYRQFLVFQITFQVAFFLALFYSRHLRCVHACCVSVCNRHSLNTKYYITNFGGVPESFNSKQMECMCDQNGPQFKVSSERLSKSGTSPLLKGIANHRDHGFFAITNCASTVIA